MHMGHVPHVMADLVLFRLQDVLLCQLFLTSRFMPEANVEMGIKELTIQSLLGWLVGLGSGEDVGWLEFAPVEIVDLHHRNAAVVADGEQILLSFFNAIFPSHTEITPGGILDVLVVKGLIQLKLLGPFLKFARVVVRNPSLSLPGFCFGILSRR